jgi:hypothetical protein
MEAYSNIKAYRSVGLDIKGYRKLKPPEASRGPAKSISTKKCLALYPIMAMAA